ncbi:hypothetical protein OROHE_012653 [Orobanche hederae]
MKVVVEEAVDGGAEVLISTEEIRLVREALERPGPPKKHARQDDQSSQSDMLKELFSVAATLFTDPLQMPWDTTTFGCGGDDVPMYRSYNDLIKIIQDEQWLKLSILQFWTLYLSKLNVGTMDEDLYGYFDPQSIQNMGNKGEDASGDIASRMSAAKNRHTLKLTITNHWQLLAIIPAKGEVVWFCSLHRKPDNRIKAVVQNVINKVEIGSVGITSYTGCRLLYELVLPMDG